MKEAINPLRRLDKIKREKLGFKTNKAYRKWQKKQRRFVREQEGK